ncbi:dTDP-4-dehydrorhamnose 3,5-epimerase family protein [Henriciella sp.]|uniref:dTDP-4-dehydrorhamnose 3,5-epimerase family protein n=1 Tax=Henriciella sp. TaxID=1968823 RepID=UPI00345DAB99
MQDNQAFSAVPGTLRGLHFQASPHAQVKLIQAVSGEIFDAVVDSRTGSPTFGRGLFVKLSATRPQAFYVPAGFAHGYQTLTPDALVSYKETDIIRRMLKAGFCGMTPLAIDWPYRGEVVTSERDQTWPSLSALNSTFVYKS